MVEPAADLGLQAERTTLSWERTIAALAIGTAIGARYGFPVAPALVLCAVSVVVPLLVLAFAATASRHRHLIAALHGDTARESQSGGVIGMVTTVTLVLVVVALVVVIAAGGELRAS